MPMSETLQLHVPTHLKPGSRLQHYTGGLYRVEGACHIEASKGTGILYRPEQGDAAHILWMRPAVEFDDLVPTPNGTMRRFSPR